MDQDSIRLLIRRKLAAADLPNDSIPRFWGSACRTQLRSVSAAHPICSAIEVIARPPAWSCRILGEAVQAATGLVTLHSVNDKGGSCPLCAETHNGEPRIISACAGAESPFRASPIRRDSA